MPAEALEQVLRAVEVPLLVERVRHQSVASRPDRNRALSLRDHHAGKGGLAGLGDSLAQHGIDIAAGSPSGAR